MPPPSWLNPRIPFPESASNCFDFWNTQYFGTPSIVEIKRHTLPPGLYSVNFIIHLEKLKPAKNYNKLQSNDKRKIIEYEEVSLNCIDTTNDNEGIFLLFYS